MNLENNFIKKFGKNFKQNEISEGIQQHDDSVFELNVIPEDVSEEVSLEIDKQIKAELKKAEAILNPKLFERKLKFRKWRQRPPKFTIKLKISEFPSSLAPNP